MKARSHPHQGNIALMIVVWHFEVQPHSQNTSKFEEGGST